MDYRLPENLYRINNKFRVLNIEYICAVYDYAGKADLSKGYWNPKRKLGVATHFFFRDN